MTPIVLQHGLFGFSDIAVGKLKLSYFKASIAPSPMQGHPLIVSRVHPTSSIELRARQLKLHILTQLRAIGRPKDRVVILAHSMGGLDARYMITKLKMADRVAALVTLSTPHRGSPYADWCLRNLGKRMGGLKLIKFLGLDLKAIRDLTTEECASSTTSIEDAPDVRYFSISGARPWHRMAPIFLHSHKIIADHRRRERRHGFRWQRDLGRAPANLALRSSTHGQSPARSTDRDTIERRLRTIRSGPQESRGDGLSGRAGLIHLPIQPTLAA